MAEISRGASGPRRPRRARPLALADRIGWWADSFAPARLAMEILFHSQKTE